MPVAQAMRQTGAANIDVDDRSKRGMREKAWTSLLDAAEKLFGEKGKHARTAVGVAGLPFNIAVEVEMVVELEDSN